MLCVGIRIVLACLPGMHYHAGAWERGGVFLCPATEGWGTWFPCSAWESVSCLPDHPVCITTPERGNEGESSSALQRKVEAPGSHALRGNPYRACLIIRYAFPRRSAGTRGCLPLPWNGRLRHLVPMLCVGIHIVLAWSSGMHYHAGAWERGGAFLCPATEGWDIWFPCSAWESVSCLPDHPVCITTRERGNEGVSSSALQRKVEASGSHALRGNPYRACLIIWYALPRRSVGTRGKIYIKIKTQSKLKRL